ncbi:hypothetical protein KIS4809_1067 [Bacillus sp. ZZV12-4809]|nr:hypothetical protein KIS4809_1067 [Bacillus sp. ZZV12-4809]
MRISFARCLMNAQLFAEQHEAELIGNVEKQNNLFIRKGSL